MMPRCPIDRASGREAAVQAEDTRYDGPVS